MKGRGGPEVGTEREGSEGTTGFLMTSLYLLGYLHPPIPGAAAAAEAEGLLQQPPLGVGVCGGARGYSVGKEGGNYVRGDEACWFEQQVYFVESPETALSTSPRGLPL